MATIEGPFGYQTMKRIIQFGYHFETAPGRYSIRAKHHDTPSFIGTGLAESESLHFQMKCNAQRASREQFHLEPMAIIEH